VSAGCASRHAPPDDSFEKAQCPNLAAGVMTARTPSVAITANPRNNRTMPSVTPRPESIRAFKNEAGFEAWLAANHARKTEVFLRIYKKDSGRASVTYAEALDVALCWGWIDGIRKAYDETSFLQRFTPRKPKSVWSQINREHVARLIAAGRMQPPGQSQVDAAKADGRWQAAYASQSRISVPPDLMRAIEAEPKALETFRRLNRQNVYALSYRILRLKSTAARTRRIAEYVAMLGRGQSIYPNAGTSTRAAGPSAAKTLESNSARGERAPVKGQARAGRVPATSKARR
jgi:uncharacterized protein YdeI (YjbR/CyaY-like superfamily)